ncbi:2-isopropylmalate synthase [Paenactinomyces guangxiensis]|uniref:2-isopropylmalate synthase n=1 Tax=Paenactinomyces guangxiensis TaxID=1490290 RepID=A0A7W1WR36_9BACL|nr:2-isopropylmalate synthase [Paenactinomyces guangxiensis]MBA4494529.1 2-isopropylmalate synthase [Paenactinomyces guangxiensis]MBH8591709.1 2-isopropylmalate synthase [Paenactinomyces guangxiensis]
MRTIYIFDTTLRDGEQSPGVNLSASEKVEIATQLERLGVNVIEAGFAASSPGDLQAVREVAKTVKNSSVCSLSRSVQGDIDQAWEALQAAESPYLHIFLATSPIHRQYKLRMSKEQVLERAEEAIRYAKRFFPVVEFSAEDAGRTEIDFLCEVADRAIQAGADVINLPDTVGYLTPEEYANIFVELRKRVPNVDRVRLSAHCHDDLGMAVANSLAAIQAGVEQVEGTINGIGERAGNAAIEEIAMAIKTRESLYQVQTTLNLKEIDRTSRLVSKLTGMFVPGNKAVVGANAFAHEAGIHQDGVLKHKSTYEIMTPETIGLTESRLILGKHSGRHAFRDKLTQLGYPQSDEQINVLFARFKELADRKKEITDDDLIALVEEKLGEASEVYTLESIHISYGSHSLPTASLRIRHQSHGKLLEEAACGNGSVDAIFKTIDRITGEKAELVDYRIHSVTQGKDALGEVHVRLEQNEISVRGRGVSTDVLEASARAYLDAVNRLVKRKEADQKGELQKKVTV